METNYSATENKEQTQIVDNNMKEIPIGEIVCNRMKYEGRSKKWLARKLGYSKDRLYRALKREYMSTEVLLQISIAMDHDFFSYLTEYYNNKKRETAQTNEENTPPSTLSQ
ncbi:MAG: hypothetical protein LBH82_01605 [Bacteroidales bacterium]|jgi:lambda repressor-like predicted transcriptional regulator|nr:hypothetical protein [Bacteroidales bacterium]